MRATAKCRSCGAPIRWAVAEATGKRMPLDPMAVGDGNVWVVRWDGDVPVIRVALTGDAVPHEEPLRYVSHFVTCPQRDEWRKRG